MVSGSSQEGLISLIAYRFRFLMTAARAVGNFQHRRMEQAPNKGVSKKYQRHNQFPASGLRPEAWVFVKLDMTVVHSTYQKNAFALCEESLDNPSALGDLTIAFGLVHPEDVVEDEQEWEPWIEYICARAIARF
jgi:hypothetical protein